MNFTREPIIETIITPREGYKLSVRSSKGGGQEEYFVDAIEVVSFGHSFFFRCLEKPKPFLVPASDYEIVETKETRVALKNVNVERSIKIGGGREASVRSPKEPIERIPESASLEQEATPAIEGSSEAPQDQRLDKKRDRRRHRRRRSSDERTEPREWSEKPRQTDEGATKEPSSTVAVDAIEGGGANDETQVSSSMFSKLFPPPPTLISETLSRYKDKDFAGAERNILSKPIEDPEEQDFIVSTTPEEHKEKQEKEEKPKPDDENAGSEPYSLQRSALGKETFSDPYSFPMHGLFSNDPPFMT